jgi:hypothetical protein
MNPSNTQERCDSNPEATSEAPARKSAREKRPNLVYQDYFQGSVRGNNKRNSKPSTEEHRTERRPAIQEGEERKRKRKGETVGPNKRQKTANEASSPSVDFKLRIRVGGQSGNADNNNGGRTSARIAGKRKNYAELEKFGNEAEYDLFLLRCSRG